MRILACFGRKGGVGRTTVAMLLASAHLALGRRVHVCDATEHALRTRHGHDRPAWFAWVTAAARDRATAGRLLYSGCTTAAEVSAVVREARAGGVDVLVVDTCRDPGPAQHRALLLADLVIAPFMRASEAEAVSASVLRHHEGRAVGVLTCARGTARERRAIRAAFDPEAGPVLRSELPMSDFAARNIYTRYLPRELAHLEAEEGDTPEVRDGAATLRAALGLTAEIDWYLQDLTLKPAPDADDSADGWLRSGGRHRLDGEACSCETG